MDDLEEYKAISGNKEKYEPLANPDKFEMNYYKSCDALYEIRNIIKKLPSNYSKLGKVDFSKVKKISSDDVDKHKKCLSGALGTNGSSCILSDVYNKLYNSINMLYNQDKDEFVDAASNYLKYRDMLDDPNYDPYSYDNSYNPNEDADVATVKVGLLNMKFGVEDFIEELVDGTSFSRASGKLYDELQKVDVLRKQGKYAEADILEREAKKEFNETLASIIDDKTGNKRKDYFTNNDVGTTINDNSRLSYDSSVMNGVYHGASVVSRVGSEVLASQIPIPVLNKFFSGLIGADSAVGRKLESMTIDEVMNGNGVAEVFSSGVTGMAEGLAVGGITDFGINLTKAGYGVATSIADVGVKETTKGLTTSLVNKVGINSLKTNGVKGAATFLAKGAGNALLSSDNAASFISSTFEGLLQEDYSTSQIGHDFITEYGTDILNSSVGFVLPGVGEVLNFYDSAADSGLLPEERRNA